MFIKIRPDTKIDSATKIVIHVSAKARAVRYVLRTSNWNNVNKLPYAPQLELTQVNNCLAVMSLLCTNF